MLFLILYFIYINIIYSTIYNMLYNIVISRLGLQGLHRNFAGELQQL